MNSSAIFCVAEETGATLQRVKSKIKDFRVGFKLISTEEYRNTKKMK